MHEYTVLVIENAHDENRKKFAENLSCREYMMLSLLNSAVDRGTCGVLQLLRVWNLPGVERGDFLRYHDYVFIAVGLPHGNLKPAGVAGAHGSVFDHIGGKADGHS